MRDHNRKNIVNYLFRYGEMTKYDLATRLNISLPTISVILKELNDIGLVAKGESLGSSGGRPPSLVKLVFDAKYSIGVSISMDHVRIVVANLGPEIKCESKFELKFENSDDYWSKVNDLAESFITFCQLNEEQLLGIGVSIPAPIDGNKSVMPIHLKGDENLWDLDMIRRAFKRKLKIGNEVKMAGIAQVWASNEYDDVVYVFISHYIGGVVFNKRNIVGDKRKSAEFGHMVLDPNGNNCTCGKKGCFASYCTSTSLQKNSGVPLSEFFSKLQAGEPVFIKIWEEYLDYLAIAVNNIRTIFDMDIIIGGEMSQYIMNYQEELRQRVAQMNIFGEDGSYLRFGDYGEFDSAIGAALMQNDDFLSL